MKRRARPRTAMRSGAWLTTPLALMLWASATPTAGPAERLPDGFPTTRGQLAFFNAIVYMDPEANARQLERLSHFDLLVTNGVGVADEQTRAMLQGRGCRLFLYWWANGFYEADIVSAAQDARWRDELAAVLCSRFGHTERNCHRPLDEVADAHCGKARQCRRQRVVERVREILRHPVRAQ